MPVIGPKKLTKEAEISALRRAIAVERRARYADFQGRHSTFSQFMRTTADRLCRRYPSETVWATVRALFRQYPNVDVATRISIVHRVEELVVEIWGTLELEGEHQALSNEQTAAHDAEDADTLEGTQTESTYVSQGEASTKPAGTRPSTSLPQSGSTPSSAAGKVAPTGDQQGLGGRFDGTVGAGGATAKPGAPSSQSDSRVGSPSKPGSPAAHSNKPGVSAKPGSPAADPNKPGVPAKPGSPAADPNKPGVPAKPGSPAAPSDTASGTGAKPGAPAKQSERTGAPPAKPNEPAYKKGAGVEFTAVQYVKGVGPKFAGVLNNFGINTVEDLLRHYPRRHLDFANRSYIKQLQQGQEVTVFGTIRTVNAYQSRNKNISILNITIGDGTGNLNITKFIGGKSNKYLLDRFKDQYPKGAQVLASGVSERDKFSNRMTLKNAEVEVLGFTEEGDEGDIASASIHAGRLVPVYPLTEGLSLKHLRNVIYNAVQSYGNEIVDPLPESISTGLNLCDLRTGYEQIHFPKDLEAWETARRRLVFDELFAIQLQLAQRRYKFDQTEGALRIECPPGGFVDKLLQSLPFTLTGAQMRVFNEIRKDLASGKPMHRLVQGDVGSGKTIVALLALMIAIENRYQGVMMAPTEILAEQHFRQFQRLITPLGLRTCLVVGKQGQKERREVRQQILSGQINIAVGTHALLEEDVEFQNLGLIIIDEQHRFGVKQRARLKAKSQSPELLTMTATPIPRTLALSIHGDLDVSEIDELPPGRKPIKTKLLKPGQRKELLQFMRREIDAGRQVYVVFPLIEESETLAAKAATQEFERLKDEKEFAGLNIGLMHGKLKPQEKDEIMDQFRCGEFQLLVCTTVIEVGVDVPNATVMVIENADRFGLAQLHQLRGRVGRGGEQSYCFLISDSRSDSTRERIAIMEQTNDGFVIAEKDLELRGPGEFMGYRQSGLPDLILADLVKDARTLEEARNAAIALIKEDPELNQSPALQRVLARKSSSMEPEVVRSG